MLHILIPLAVWEKMNVFHWAACMKIYRGALKCEHRMYLIGARSHYHGNERRRLVQFAAVTFWREGRAAAITVMGVHHIRRRWR